MALLNHFTLILQSHHHTDKSKNRSHSGPPAHDAHDSYLSFEQIKADATARVAGSLLGFYGAYAAVGVVIHSEGPGRST